MGCIIAKRILPEYIPGNQNDNAQDWRCPKQHSLAAPPNTEEFWCDVCRKNGTRSPQGLYCNLCDYDVCTECKERGPTALAKHIQATVKINAYFEAAYCGNLSDIDRLLKEDHSLLDAKHDQPDDYPYPLQGATALIYAAIAGKTE